MSNIYRGSTVPGTGSVVRGNADEIDIADAGNIITATNVEDALQEIQTALDVEEAALVTHIADTTTHGTTGDIVGTSDTQTLTNKSLDDTTTAIVDTSDATKKIAFDAGGTTATTTTVAAAQTANRTITLPDATDTLVGKATTDTLTNKTLTSPDINAGTADDLTSLTVAANSSGNVSRQVMDTAQGGTGTEDGANTWALLATFHVDSTSYRYAGGTFLIQDTYQGQTNSSALLSVFLVQNTAGLDATDSDLKVLSIDGGTRLTHDSFKLIASATTNGTDIELWVNKKTQYGRFRVYEIAFDSGAGFSDPTYPDTPSAWQSATPTGAVTVTSDWAGAGTYVPTLFGATTAGAGTYTTQTASYTRGNGRVVGTGRLTWTAHTGTGTMRISLPSTVANGSAHYSTHALWTNDVNIGAGKVPTLLLIVNTNYGDVYGVDPVTGTGPITMDTAGDMIFFFDYEEA